MTRFIGLQDSIYMPSFMCFSAVVSVICLLNGKKKKKNLEIYSFQLSLLPAILHTVWYSNLNQSYLIRAAGAGAAGAAKAAPPFMSHASTKN